MGEQTRDGPSIRIETDGAMARIVYDGTWITVMRTDDADGQLAVFVNTEDAERDNDDAGAPLLQVVLNDATLYDGEPLTLGSSGHAQSYGTGRECVYCGLVIEDDQARYLDDDGGYWHQACRDEANPEDYVIEWAITTTPNDPPRGCISMQAGRTALDALDQWADSMEMARYSDTMYGPGELGPERNLVGHDEQGRVWAIHSNYTVFAVPVTRELERATHMVAIYDVRTLAPDERDWLALEVSVQSETSDNHEGVPAPEIRWQRKEEA